MTDTTPYFSGQQPIEIRDGLTAVRYNDVEAGHQVAALLREEGFEVDEEEREEVRIVHFGASINQVVKSVSKYLMVVIHS